MAKTFGSLKSNKLDMMDKLTTGKFGKIEKVTSSANESSEEKPELKELDKLEENMDEDTRERFSRAKKPSEFSITKMDYKNTVSEEADDEPTFNTSPNKHKNKTNEELLQNISTGLTNILTSALKKKGNNKNSRSERSVSLKTLLRLFLL